MKNICCIILTLLAISYANQFEKECSSSSFNKYFSNVEESEFISQIKYNCKTASDNDSNSVAENSNPKKTEKQKISWKIMLKRFFKGILKAF